MDDVKEQNPTDISCVYNGYTPLSAASSFPTPAWWSIKVLCMCPWLHFEEQQPLPLELQRRRQQGEYRVTLIFSLRSVTFAEIAALLFLSQLEDGSSEYDFTTTKLVNAASWTESLMEKSF